MHLLVVISMRLLAVL